MTLFSSILIAAIALFMISSFLFFVFKIALVVATIKLFYKSKEDIKYFITSLAEHFSKHNNHKQEGHKNKEKEIREFTEVKPGFNKNYNKEKGFKDFRRIK